MLRVVFGLCVLACVGQARRVQADRFQNSLDAVRNDAEHSLEATPLKGQLLAVNPASAVRSLRQLVVASAGLPNTNNVLPVEAIANSKEADPAMHCNFVSTLKQHIFSTIIGSSMLVALLTLLSVKLYKARKTSDEVNVASRFFARSSLATMSDAPISAPQAPEPPFPTMTMSVAIGSRVKLVSLKARADLNGACGEITSYVEDTGQWAVSLDGEGTETLTIKPDNLEVLVDLATKCDQGAIGVKTSRDDLCLMVGSHVQIDGMQARPELNSRWGRAMHFDEAKDRWKVCVYAWPEQAPLALKPGNLQPLSKKFRIDQIQGKGRGAIATAAVHKGELILAEMPAFMCSGRDFMSANMSGSEDEMIARHVARLSRKDQDSFWALHDCHLFGSKVTAQGIFKTNAIAAGEGHEEGRRHGVYLIGSCFNHSCCPNVTRVWLESEGVEVFHAARDIKAGEELCVYYQNVHQTKISRQASLLEAFKFFCTCDSCKLEGAALEKSDMLREEYRRLDDEILCCVDSRKGIEKVKRIISIIEEEFAGNPWDLKRSYYDGFQMAFSLGLQLGDMTEAKVMMKKTIESQIMCEGNHNDNQMLKWKYWLENPTASISDRQKSI